MSGPRSPTRESEIAAREKRATEILLYLLAHGATVTAKLVSDVATSCGGERLFKATQKFVQSRLWIEGEDTAHPFNKAWKLTESGQAEALTRKTHRETEKSRRTA